jgi:hypothetical protein
MRTRVSVRILATVVFALGLEQRQAQAVPYFARKYKTNCVTCHIIPPKLNHFGEDFLARGYRLPASPPQETTWPFAVWATWRGQWEASADRGRGLPNRVELISAGPVGGTRAFYFVEWLPVSQEVGSNNTRVERHGRFEDLFVSLPVGSAYLTVGQFRPLTQVDVSRRLSLSEPLAFSTALLGQRARSARLTALRSFSLSGRSPAIQLRHHWARGPRLADGWYNSVTLPFAGEWVIPLNSRVHRERGFEFEFRPKGVLLESYYRHGLSSIGGHAFLGGDRRLFGLVGAYNRGPFFSTAALGFARERTGQNDTRFSWENELVPARWLALGLRVDDRTGSGRPAALIPHINFEFPLTSYTVRTTIEHRQQRANRLWLFETGVIF